MSRRFLACATVLALMAPSSHVLAQVPATSPPNQAGPAAPAGPAGQDPDNEQFDLLLKARSRYRGIAEQGGWPAVPDGEPMKPGKRYDCARLDALAKRLAVEGYEEWTQAKLAQAAPTTTTTTTTTTEEKAASAGGEDASADGSPAAGETPRCKYPRELAGAVKDFQHDRYITRDGIVGGKTQAQLSKPVGDVLAKIDYAIKRWRANAANMTGEYIVVNIPAFELGVYDGRKEALRMPVIVGMADWQTPEMSDKLEHIVVNPAWHIPQSIAEAEVLPKSRKNPGYLERHNIVRGENGLLTQKPGPQNPLGQLKFMMPNRKDIYLHDTPHEQKFEAPARAFSHGCVRVERPVDLATFLLRNDPEWSRESIQAAIDSGETQTIQLESTTPVHLLYIPAVAGADGRLRVAPDIYDKIGNASDERATEPAPTEEEEFLPGWP